MKRDELRERGESCKSVESRPRFAFISLSLPSNVVLKKEVFWIHSFGSSPLISFKRVRITKNYKSYDWIHGL